MSEKRAIWLVADDYAQDPAIDAAILALAGAGRLSATSVLTQSPHWPAAAAALLDQPELAVGLHFNLTHVWQGRAPSLARVILAALAGSLPGPWLRQLWREQIDRFEDALGRAPDYIDGHQHVHQLPQIRGMIVEEMARRYGRMLPLRSTLPRHWRGWKAALIAGLGARGIPVQCRLNSDFAGVYAFQGERFAAMMRRWLQDIRTGGMVMCHPGGRADGDPLAASRPQEWAYLASPDFIKDLDRAGVRLLHRRDMLSLRSVSGA